MTSQQLYALVIETVRLCKIYDIPVSPYSTLSHAEIQPTLGITQRAKWDITAIPGMTEVGNPLAVGDMIRDMVKRELWR